MDPVLMMCVKCQQRLGRIIQRSFSVQNQSVLQRNYYQVLGVKKTATPREIKAAYIELSKQLHPDTNLSIKQPLNEQKDQHNSFVELNQAYAILSKSLSRREYDFSLDNPGTQTVRVHVRRAGHATADDPYDTQQGQQDWYRDMGAFHQGSHQSASENYYGIKGVRRVNSVYIVYGCLTFLVVGALVHFIIFKQSSDYVISRLDEKDRRIAAIYNEAKARAMQNGNKKQMELLKARQEEFSLKLKQDPR
ncbi:dnaJ homolog subfamily C member 4-like [Acanthaster planci]|uniref:DnaJ homolog subfamily C member 4-like n=1 Tax=Acanthaster planci TaxID=133434 RepID=A0A8B7YCN0_ACAPL|nr:dnaJ homolog subfamily C member 4-like [Acanthaster planci]